MKKRLALLLMVLSIIFTGITPVLAEVKSLRASIVTVADTVSYLIVDVNDYGKSPSNILLDGEKVEFTPVNDEQTIFKTEFDGSHKSLTVVFNTGEKVEKDITNIYGKFPYKTTNLGSNTPDIVWGHATMAVWDFHTVAKDENGKEVVVPLKTTFATKDQKLPKVDPDVVSGATTAVEKFLVNKDIEFTYNLKNEVEKNKYNKIQAIKKIHENGGYDRLKIRKSKTSDIGTVKIILDGSKSIESLGKHKVEISYRGIAKEIREFEVVEKLPVADNVNPVTTASSNDYDYRKDIVLSYDLNNEVEKNKYNRLESIVKVYENGQEADLQIKKYEEGSKGIVKILFGISRPIQNIGRNDLKLIFKGLSPEKKTIFYKEVAPTIWLTADSGEYVANKSIIFNLKGFEYTFQQNPGITNVYLNGTELVRRRVINNDEDYDALIARGEDVLKNESGNPWHVVGETFRIKNDGIKLLKKGVNHLSIKYEGYKDSSIKFVLGEGNSISTAPKEEAPKRARRAVDAMSSATGGGVSKPSIGSGDNAGGSVNMGVTLAYDFEMVANAKILEVLGYKNEDAKSLLDAWEGTSKEVAILRSNPTRKVIWDGYLNYVQRNRIDSGVYKSFGQYFEDADVKVTQNAPYQVKYVVGKGIGAPIFTLSKLITGQDAENNLGLKKVPENVLRALDTVKVGQKLEFHIDHWAANIEKIVIESKELVRDVDYSYDYSNNLLKLTNKYFLKPGNVKVQILSKGYQEYNKNSLVVSETAASYLRLREETYKDNQVFTGDPLRFDVTNPKAKVSAVAVSVNNGESKNLVLGSDYYYTETLGLLEIKGELTKVPGTYNIVFSSVGEKDSTVTVNIKGPELKFVKAPLDGDNKYAMVADRNGFTLKNHTGNREISSWIDSISAVKVNGKDAVNSDSLEIATSYTINRNKETDYDPSAALNIKTGVDKVSIEIFAKGYTTVVINYTLDGNNEIGQKDLTITQLNPETGEKVDELYSKIDYMPKNNVVENIAPYNKEEMEKNFPGMNYDFENKKLQNDGSFSEYNKFIANIERVEINGKRIGFGTTGVLISDAWSNNKGIVFFVRVSSGDIITVHSQGFNTFHYMIP